MTEQIASLSPAWIEDTFRCRSAALYRSAWRMTRNAADAEDLVQDTFAKALGACDRSRPATNPDGWLHRIMVNTFISGCRKRQREPYLDADPGSRADLLRWRDYPPYGRSAEEEVLAAALSAEVMSALAALPTKNRLVVYLADVAGLNYQQIADLTGISLGTVKSSLHRGRTRVRARLSGSSGPARQD